MQIAVIVASSGRSTELTVLGSFLARQTYQAQKVVYSIASVSDVDNNFSTFDGETIIIGPPGLPAQRNRGLDIVVKCCDIVVFFDDDYLPSRFALEGISYFFERNRDVVGINGLLLADGIDGPGMTVAMANKLIDKHDENQPKSFKIMKVLDSLYGCNMAMRAEAIGNLRFDESLPFYGWQEDVDFTAQLRRKGKLVRTDAFAGVHRGVKTGRSSGVCLGYSQVANPIYLARKGTMKNIKAFRLIVKNIAANYTRRNRPEPWIDREGRFQGNILALTHLRRGILDPRFILKLR